MYPRWESSRSSRTIVALGSGRFPCSGSVLSIADELNALSGQGCSMWWFGAELSAELRVSELSLDFFKERGLGENIDSSGGQGLSYSHCPIMAKRSFVSSVKFINGNR